MRWAECLYMGIYFRIWLGSDSQDFVGLMLGNASQAEKVAFGDDDHLLKNLFRDVIKKGHNYCHR